MKLHHIGIEYTDQEKAKTFFSNICGLDLLKAYELNEQLSKEIFSINKSMQVLVFQNNYTYIEVFITNKVKNTSFEHICLQVLNKNKFIEKCKHYELKPFTVMKNDKELLFVRDFSHNLFEIKGL